MAVSGFVALDYIVLIGFLLLSTAIGVYFAWSDRRQQTNKQFLTANKQLGWLPVSLSMMASFLSSIAILGLPSEVFVHGSTLWMGAISSSISVLLAAYVFLPMYYKMDITSINEVRRSRAPFRVRYAYFGFYFLGKCSSCSDSWRALLAGESCSFTRALGGAIGPCYF